MPADNARPGVGGRAYRRYVAAQVISLFGTTMRLAALWWLVLRTGHGSAFDLSAVEAAQCLPLLLLSRRGGSVVARLGSARSLALTQGLLAAVTLAIAIPLLAGWITVWYLMAASLAIGCIQCADLPGRQMFMLDLLGEDELRRGASLYSAILGLSRIAGPAVAGAIIALAGEGPVFVIDAASFLVVVAVVWGLRGEAVHATRAGPQAAPGTRRFRWVLDLPPGIQLCAALAVLIGGLAYQFAVVNPLMATRVFHLGAVGYGLLATFLAIGGIAANYWSSRRGSPRLREVVAWAGLYGAVDIAASVAPAAWAYYAAMIAIGGLLALFTSSCGVYVQQHASPEQRPHAVSAYNAGFIGFVPFGAFVVAAIAAAAGPRWALAGPGLAVLAAVCAAVLIRQRSRRAAPARTSPA
ncbi:MAG TPA: MFS transporter [Streptosporangiaceae bacterium]|jgi:MFS family permease